MVSVQRLDVYPNPARVRTLPCTSSFTRLSFARKDCEDVVRMRDASPFDISRRVGRALWSGLARLLEES